nr:retrotransposon protein, putative, Ty1-copia subclass [Tanacetum cinerariifolium]
MLADAKLPVTFWAEAVNTAYYVQNRVLVNKSQNKTPYELFNDNLGKFEANGDEGYFIGYSMSSKAFRVFNKRTRRVEESLHVEFLENKASEKGVGPNWLFDIDCLTKSINYVPVDAGTNSTNFSGTKVAANQEVKKDVYSLRYIVLPNWAHDALLESSSSKPHVESSTQVPDGSGNLNPTASSSNPIANQMETLTVESPIPTVSLPVPTACLNDSPKPSSEARLISKRVTNQEETPSLDNILSLTNRFEDILGVTTSSDEAIGVKTNKIWTLVDCPKGVRPIGTKWVLKNKKDERGTIMDVKSAFLYGIIDEEVYVMQPPRFQDLAFPAKVYKVEKAMYGLHQAPRACLYAQKFQMSAMGELNFFFGLQVLQKEDGIFLSQDKYIGDILKKFGFSDVRSSNTPMDKENPWGKDGTGKDVDLHLYRSMIRSLMYLTASRPDIMFVICACARHQVTPKECHLHAVKRIFRYLKGHPKLGLWYPKASPFDLVAFSDSDYGGDFQDRKSTTGGSQFLGDILKKFGYSDVRSSNTPMDKENPWGKDGTGKDVDLHLYRSMIGSLMYLTASRPDIMFAVCACTRHQTIIATSTTEAEYVAAASCCGQVL